MWNLSKTCCMSGNISLLTSKEPKSVGGKKYDKLSIPLLVLIVICFCGLPVHAKYGGGTGEPNNPYLIYTAEQMNAIGADSNDWDKDFILMADIDLSGFTGTSFNIIGELYYDSGWIENPFTGVFDGNGHTISNFTYDCIGANRIGLFGYVSGENAEIKDLVLIDPNVDAEEGWDVGSLAGYLKEGTITNCQVEGGSVRGCWGIGGLVGRNCGTITNCYATGNVMGTCSCVGGLVGVNDEGTITRCYSTGRVTGKGLVGSLVGANEEGTISNCYSTGRVTGYKEVAGLVGSNSYGTIFNCYSTGKVSGNTSVGGLVGYNEFGDVANSFWDIDISDCNISAGGIGKNTAEMQNLSTFIDAGWDFENVWWILEGRDYPRLLWADYFGGGSGQPDDPYLIYTAEQLNTIGLIPCLWNRHFKLMADIDLSSYTGDAFNIIGSWQDDKPFTGVFDGNGHKISNFNCTFPHNNFVGLLGYVFDADAEIKNLGLIAPNVDAGSGSHVGALVGRLKSGTITNCFVEGGIVKGGVNVGGLVGNSWDGNITNCFTTSNVAGYTQVGGLVGHKGYGTITNCYSTGSVSGSIQYSNVGGLLGINSGIITNCYSTGSVSGKFYVGGLAGQSYGTFTNCYSAGSVSGHERVGGLIGGNWDGTITNCYSTGDVRGNYEVGGLVGYHDKGSYSKCFWDYTVNSGLSGIGNTTNPNVIGESTTNMQIEKTFTDAGWDFIGETLNGIDDIWIIVQQDYPRLWWALVPVLHAEPEVTLGTSNTISWEPLAGDVEYYAECSEDAYFTSILHNTNWITETSYEFTDLQLGRQYWYSVKARNIAGTETNWSNVETSLQGTLADAVEKMLAIENLKSANMKSALLNKINSLLDMVNEGLYEDSLNKLEYDILAKMNGCGENGEPDKNDWIITCEEQSEIYPLIIETIEYIKGLIEQSAE